MQQTSAGFGVFAVVCVCTSANKRLENMSWNKQAETHAQFYGKKQVAKFSLAQRDLHKNNHSCANRFLYSQEIIRRRITLLIPLGKILFFHSIIIFYTYTHMYTHTHRTHRQEVVVERC